MHWAHTVTLIWPIEKANVKIPLGVLLAHLWQLQMEALSLVGCECRDGSDLAREQSLHQQSSSSSNILSLAFKVAKTIQCISLSIMPIGDVNSLWFLMSVRCVGWLVYQKLRTGSYNFMLLLEHLFRKVFEIFDTILIFFRQNYVHWEFGKKNIEIIT